MKREAYPPLSPPRRGTKEVDAKYALRDTSNASKKVISLEISSPRLAGQALCLCHSVPLCLSSYNHSTIDSFRALVATIFFRALLSNIRSQRTRNTAPLICERYSVPLSLCA